jgi:hypothetical protein
MESIAHFIDRPISELPFSRAFIEQSASMGFQTIAQICGSGAEALVQIPGFSYHWLGELIRYLTERQALHLLQPSPGNISG